MPLSGGFSELEDLTSGKTLEASRWEKKQATSRGPRPGAGCDVQLQPGTGTAVGEAVQAPGRGVSGLELPTAHAVSPRGTQLCLGADVSKGSPPTWLLRTDVLCERASRAGRRGAQGRAGEEEEGGVGP